MERNILLTIAYDGTEFCGWQRQPNRPTIQGHLEQTMSALFDRKIALNGTSRTDAGVHALGQRASFVLDVNIPVDRIPPAVNNALAGREKRAVGISPVRILAAEEKPPGFHARFDARGKKYVYRIEGGGEIDLFQRNYLYHVERPLDGESMAAAGRLLMGTHDFKSFEASGGNPRENTIRTIFDLQVLCPNPQDAPRILEIHVTGDGFLYNMVRIITGTLVDIGLGKRRPDEITDILEAKNRGKAGHTAPPQGLYLAEIYYE